MSADTLFEDPAEQEAFSRLRSVARELSAEDLTLDEPPASLWERIKAEAGEAEGARQPLAEREAAPVVDLRDARRRRRPRGTWVFGLAAAVVAGVFVGVWALVGSDDDVMGTAQLAALGDRGAGTAELVDEDGRMVLHVDLDDVEAPEGGYLELWLIQSTEPLRLISLGPVNSSGSYEVPAGVDPADFPVVDVSREPLDGNADHSGDSVVRGPLDLA